MFIVILLLNYEYITVCTLSQSLPVFNGLIFILSTCISHNLSEHLQEGAFNALSDTVKEFLENLSSVRVVDVRHEQIIVSYNIHNIHKGLTRRQSLIGRSSRVKRNESLKPKISASGSR